MRCLLVPHPLHVHWGQLSSVWHHHKWPVLRRPLQKGHQHPGTGPAVHRTDGFCSGRGLDSHHKGEQKAVEHEKAPQLLQTSCVQSVMFGGNSEWGTLNLTAHWIELYLFSMGASEENNFNIVRGDIYVHVSDLPGLTTLSTYLSLKCA